MPAWTRDLITLGGALAPVFLLIALGHVLRHRCLLSAVGVADLNHLLYWILLPVQLAVAVGSTDVRRDFDARALIAGAAAFLLGLVGAWLATSRLAPAARGSVISGVARANGAFVGLPVVLLVATTLPPAQRDQLTAIYPVLLASMVPLFNIGAVFGFLLPHHGLTRSGVAGALGELPRNPIIIGALVGIGLSLGAPEFLRPSAGIAPSPLAGALQLLGHAAIPLALLCAGLQLDLGLVRRNPRLLTVIAVGKLALVPAAAWLIGIALGLGQAALTAVVVLMACPTAMASVPMARLLGGDADLAAAITVATTVAAPLTLLIWLTLLR